MGVKHETAAIIDFGAQGQIVARLVRKLGVYCRVLPSDASARFVAELEPRGIILVGRTQSGLCDPGMFSLGVPVLGIGHSARAMCQVLGGEVGHGSEEGERVLSVLKPGDLLAGWGASEKVWMGPGNAVVAPPEGFEVLARTDGHPAACFADHERRLFGVMFHPESPRTPKGVELLSSFLFRICGFSGTWNMAAFADEEVLRIRDQVGDGGVVSALSGGVDSAVAAALVHKAVGDRLTCIFVDTGLLRKGEAEQVLDVFKRSMNMKLVVVNARERFLSKLKGVTDPERKRAAVGHEFIRVFEQEARKLPGVRFLVQGTVYPDVIESGSGTAPAVKSHHNVGGLPADMELELVEPLRDLFKDEVRALGTALGLPEEMVWRQPFPGPGLAVRVLGEVTEEKLRIARDADLIVREEIAGAGLGRSIWQYFAVLTGARSVGVASGERSYGRAIAVRAVHSEDGMTAEWARIPHEVLEAISSRITREIPEVNRVVYDITPKPPGTIEWE